MSEKIKVILGQLGSPKSTKVSDVREFLREFLSDPRVVDINPLLWKIILHLFVLPFRPKRSAEAYSRIHTEKGFPLITNTEAVARALKPKLDANLELNHAFLLSHPRVGDVLSEWEREDVQTRAQRVVILPQFPQYAESTIASVVDGLGHEFKKRVNLPTFTVVNSYHRSKAFIDHSVRKIEEALKHHPDLQEIVISFHGIPLRRVLQKKDLYLLHCLETFELISSRLKTSLPVSMTFQSRFGSEVWLGPYTDESVKSKGKKKIGVYCPSFVVDCLETTDEIGNELAHEVRALGGELIHIPCVNADPGWIDSYANFINTYVNGSEADRQSLFYPIDVQERYKAVIKEQEKNAPGELSPEAKKTLKIVFLTTFLDLVGFSIIFPMFPAMARHYLSVDADNFFLKGMMDLIGSIQSVSLGSDGAPLMTTVVLFGGLLGALYSLLQFFAAPVWGGISDRIGRRPVLFISVLGLFISYLLWVFSGSFTLLILARTIGGFMAGNLAIASAVVSDVTSDKTRSKGMASIGIAFALGFVFGPALGGILSMYNPLLHHPELAAWGINPFSAPAALAAVLSLFNLYTIWKILPETMKKGAEKHIERSVNPIKLFKPLPIRGVNLTNIAYFFFITAFSGMEFTLTFLAVERFGYTSMDNAYMFIFIGFVIGMVQGGYVRRKAHAVGEAKMSLQGLIVIVPGLVVLAYAQAGWMLYLGLFFLAMGSAMIIPCLTSLVSFYTPKHMQGQSLGIFRSLGSLGRVLGPVYASIVYWKFGSLMAYLIGAGMIIIPAVLVKLLPPPPKSSEV